MLHTPFQAEQPTQTAALLPRVTESSLCPPKVQTPPAALHTRFIKPPTAITVKTPSGKAESITLNPGEQVQLTANAWYKKFIAGFAKQLLQLVGKRRYRHDNRRRFFTANDTPQKKGEIVITAGDTQKKNSGNNQRKHRRAGILP